MNEVDTDNVDKPDSDQTELADVNTTEPEQKNDADPDADLDSEALLALAQKELAELKDQYLRARADIENVRRRSQKEQSNARKFAIEGFAAELINVRDSLELAAQVEFDQDSDEVADKMKEGLALTLKQMDAIFEKFSIVQITPEVGDKLDPTLHQAMSSQPVEDFVPNTIVTMVQKGYQLHERLLRPAMVIIAANAENSKKD